MASYQSTKKQSLRKGRRIPFLPSKRRLKQLQACFEAFLPRLRISIRMELRCRSCQDREDAVQEAMAAAWASYLRLANRGVDGSQFVSKLAHYAVCHVRNGRRIADAVNSRDVSSWVAQRKHGFRLLPLHVRSSRSESGWRECLIEDRHMTPADMAACRIDFEAWLKTLPRRQRRIALLLSLSHSTYETAKRFHVSPGRISQIRRELRQSWWAYQHLDDESGRSEAHRFQAQTVERVNHHLRGNFAVSPLFL